MTVFKGDLLIWFIQVGIPHEHRAECRRVEDGPGGAKGRQTEAIQHSFNTYCVSKTGPWQNKFD